MQLKGTMLTIVDDVAERIGRAAVNGLKRNAHHHVGEAIVEQSRVALGAVQLAAVVEAFADFVIEVIVAVAAR